MKEKIILIINNFEAYWVKAEQYIVAIIVAVIFYIFGKYDFIFSLKNITLVVSFTFYLSIILLIYCFFLTHKFNTNLLIKLKKIDQIPNLENEINELQQAVAYFKEHQIEHAFKNVNSKFLAYIAQNLKLDYTQRVSLYLVDKKRELFHIVGRYSRNGNYDRRHRRTFNINTGALGHIWRCGEQEKICLPTEEKAYLKECKDKFGLLQKDVQKLAMQSREFYAIPITESLSSQIGIIVFEAEICDTLNINDIDGCIKEFHPIFTQLLSQYKELSDIKEGENDE